MITIWHPPQSSTDVHAAEANYLDLLRLRSNNQYMPTCTATSNSKNIVTVWVLTSANRSKSTTLLHHFRVASFCLAYSVVETNTIGSSLYMQCMSVVRDHCSDAIMVRPQFLAWSAECVKAFEWLKQVLAEKTQIVYSNQTDSTGN